MKWTIVVKSVIKSKLKKLGRNLEIIVADSKAHATIKREQLPGGVMNLVRGEIPAILRKEKVEIDKLGRQIVYLFTNGKKTIISIVICHILQGSNQRICLLLT